MQPSFARDIQRTLAVVIMLLIVFAISQLLSGCGTISPNTCDSLSDVLHDASLFLCTLGQTSPATVAANHHALANLLQQYIASVEQAPPGTQRNDLLDKLKFQLACLQQSTP